MEGRAALSANAASASPKISTWGSLRLLANRTEMLRPAAHGNKKLIRRWDSERELFYDDIVHVLQNTIDSCLNSATDRRGYVLERMCLPNSVK